MAHRPVFISVSEPPFYRQADIEFQYFSGFALCQKQKSIMSLHENAVRNHPGLKPLEISSKSTVPTGNLLSAFNLKYLRKNREFALECIFQGSKVFEFGGPYCDLYEKAPRDAKRDPRLTTSGKIVKFSLDGMDFVTEPKDFFYNWIYSVALYRHPKELAKLSDYNAFTDIEFNPEKSINCQARTVAIIKGLYDAGLLDEAMKSPQEYLRIVYDRWNRD